MKFDFLFEGEIQGGVGHGRIILADSVYEGQVKLGQMHGQGKLVRDDGLV